MHAHTHIKHMNRFITVYTYICIYAYIHIHVCIHTYPYTHPYMQAQTHLHARNNNIFFSSGYNFVSLLCKLNICILHCQNLQVFVFVMICFVLFCFVMKMLHPGILDGEAAENLRREACCGLDVKCSSTAEAVGPQLMTPCRETAGSLEESHLLRSRS